MLSLSKLKHPVMIAYSSKQSRSITDTHYKFRDYYMNPEVLYGSFPPSTKIKIGGRYIVAHRSSDVKIRVLDEDEDRPFWIDKPQHAEKVSLGTFHRDFEDAKVAFSFSKPQTHIWFAGYSIHFQESEWLTFYSYNAVVNVKPEHILIDTSDNQIAVRSSKMVDLSQVTNLRKSLIDEYLRIYTQSIFKRNPLQSKAAVTGFTPTTLHAVDNFLPIYSLQLPQKEYALKDRKTVPIYRGVLEHLNDCETEIVVQDEYAVSTEVSTKSSPMPSPPIYPPLKPFELAIKLQECQFHSHKIK